MLPRLRLALQAENGGKIDGDVEVDETFIGGKARNMHAAKREAPRHLAEPFDDRQGRRHGPAGAARQGRRRQRRSAFKVIANRKKHQLEQIVAEHVEAGATLYTDALRSYDRMGERGYVHNVIDHAEAYVDGEVHTNGLENFWSLLKRAIKGTYVSVEPFHLFRYLDEQAFRFNNRKRN